jgi:hypothetical protein
MSGCHEHARQNGNCCRPAFDTALNAVGDDRPGKFKEAAFNDTIWLALSQQIGEPKEFACAFRVSAAVAGQKKCWLHICFL